MEVFQILNIVLSGALFVLGAFAVYNHLKSLDTIAKGVKEISQQIEEKE